MRTPLTTQAFKKRRDETPAEHEQRKRHIMSKFEEALRKIQKLSADDPADPDRMMARIWDTTDAVLQPDTDGT